jgi:alkylation response protein AidB-like acyl-CoA dehydrogenase
MLIIILLLPKQIEAGNKRYLFLVDTKTEGISATKLDKLGWRASDTAEIAFDNVEIPLENLMGEEGKGFLILCSILL